MANNDRVEVASGDVDYGQLAASKALRTCFTPGKATSLPGDMNWPEDFRTPTSTPAFAGEAVGPVEMTRVRVVKLGRGIVCDQTVLAPVVSGTRVETRVEEGVSGANTTVDTVNPATAASRERNTGFDNIVGA
jgi:hypothetical protein